MEIQDGDDVRDAEGCRHSRVLGDVEIAEVQSGDYEIWVTDWAVGDGGGVHDLFVVDISQRAEGERTGTGAGRSWWEGRGVYG